METTPIKPDSEAMPVASHDLLAAARMLADQGIHFWIPGRYDINPEQVVKYAEDADALYAELEGVEKWRYAAYKDYMESGGQCTGTTKKGNQCRNAGENYPSIKSFTPGISDRCDCHMDISSANVSDQATASTK